MPKQNNCDDLKVDSCVDENGQSITGGDSYNVPTGRYVKHVVSVCSSGGDDNSSDINLDDYYTKNEVDALLDDIDIPEVDLSDYYTKPEIDAQFDALDTTGVSTSGTKFSDELSLANQQDVNYYLDGKSVDLQEQIDEIKESGYDDTELRELIQAEEDERKAADNELAVELLNEKRERQDADFNLLARINGLEIPEMPGDYDDSGLRELLENEAALRATGDAYLQKQIEDIEEYDDSNVRELIEQETALRVTGDDYLQKQIEDIEAYDDSNVRELIENEVALRVTGDASLQEQIDNIDQYDDSNVRELIEQEAALRTSGDTYLQEQIDGIEQYDDSNVRELIEKEVALRASGDAALQEQLDNLDLGDVDIETLFIGEKPPEEGDYPFWFDSDRLELYVKYEDNWVPANPSTGGGSDEVDLSDYYTKDEVDSLIPEIPEAQDLESVLDQGNVSTKGAVFGGRVTAEPGRTGNEVATVGQLETLQEEIEDIRPSLERGRWTFATNMATGQYNIYRNHTEEYCNTKLAECLADASGDPVAASDCQRANDACIAKGDAPIEEWTGTKIWFNQLDLDSTLHQWDTIEPGEKLEIVNEDGSGFALYEVVEGTTTSSGGRIGIPVSHERSNGVPNGAAKVKLFKLADANPADYVRIAGDEMTGGLKITGKTSDADPLLKLVPTESSTTSSDIIRVHNTEDKVKFYVTEAGGIGTGDNYKVSRSNYLTDKAYVDKTIDDKVKEALAEYNPDLRYVAGPARCAWKVKINNSTDPGSGYAHLSGESIQSSTKIIFNFQSFATPLEAFKFDFPSNSGTIYQKSGSSANSSGMSLSVYNFSPTANKWYYRGTAEIRDLTWTDGIIKASLLHQKGTYSLTNDALYYFTIGGFM